MPFRVFKLNSESADNTIMRHRIHWLQLAATSVINGEKKRPIGGVLGLTREHYLSRTSGSCESNCKRNVKYASKLQLKFLRH